MPDDPNPKDPKDPKDLAETKPEHVSYETHRRLLDQRKQDQARAAAAEAERDRLKAEAEEAERVRLEEAKAYKDLYEKANAKATGLEKAAAERSAADLMAAKRNALRAELGGAVKDEYLQFADLGAIAMTDGAPDPEAVKQVAAKFRKEHSGLIAPAGAPLPGGAPQGYRPPAGKPLGKMTAEETLELYKRQRAEGKIKF